MLTFFQNLTLILHFISACNWPVETWNIRDWVKEYEFGLLCAFLWVGIVYLVSEISIEQTPLNFLLLGSISNLVDTKKLLIYSYNSKDMTYVRYRTKVVIKVFTNSRVCSVYCICLWENLCIAKLNIQIQDIIPTWFIKTKLRNFFVIASLHSSY